jgi:hypothetical protein
MVMIWVGNCEMLVERVEVDGPSDVCRTSLVCSRGKISGRFSSHPQLSPSLHPITLSYGQYGRRNGIRDHDRQLQHEDVSLRP